MISSVSNDKKEIVLFGIGEVLKSHPLTIMESYNVIGIVDNNYKQYSENVYGITVTAPNSLKGYNGIVAITTRYKSYPAISQQLMELGISLGQIHYLQYSFYTNELELIPGEKKQLNYPNRLLNEYDLIKNTTVKKQDKKIMLFCSFYTVYLVRLVKEVKKQYPDFSISVITKAFNYKEDLVGIADHIFVFGTFSELGDILDSIEVYDAFQILWIEHVWCYFCEEIRAKCRLLNLCVGGSDFYRSDLPGLQYKRKIIELADGVSAETEDTINSFVSVYTEAKNKICRVIHGVSVLDCIDVVKKTREEICDYFGIPSDRIIVTCGHNANVAHQHEAMAMALNKMRSEILEEIFFVYPMAYNSLDSVYIDKIKKVLLGMQGEHRVLTNFLNDDQMAEYATVSDIMIHVQKTDQLSSTMLEEMYAGAVVIAGSWLPYGSLRDAGITFFTVDTIEELGPCLEKIVTNLSSYKDQCKHNREIIRRKFSWDATIDGWISLWDK